MTELEPLEVVLPERIKATRKVSSDLQFEVQRLFDTIHDKLISDSPTDDEAMAVLAMILNDFHSNLAGDCCEEMDVIPPFEALEGLRQGGKPPWEEEA